MKPKRTIQIKSERVDRMNGPGELVRMRVAVFAQWGEGRKHLVLYRYGMDRLDDPKKYDTVYRNMRRSIFKNIVAELKQWDIWEQDGEAWCKRLVKEDNHL